MKKLTFFIPFLIILMALTDCEKEYILDDQADLISPTLESRQNKPHPVPFHATYISQLVSPPQPDPDVCGTGFPIFHIDQILEGNATHMGNIEGTVSSCFDSSAGTFLTHLNGEIQY